MAIYLTVAMVFLCCSHGFLGLVVVYLTFFLDLMLVYGGHVCECQGLFTDVVLDFNIFCSIKQYLWPLWCPVHLMGSHIWESHWSLRCHIIQLSSLLAVWCCRHLCSRSIVCWGLPSNLLNTLTGHPCLHFHQSRRTSMFLCPQTPGDNSF